MRCSQDEDKLAKRTLGALQNVMLVVQEVATHFDGALWEYFGDAQISSCVLLVFGLRDSLHCEKRAMLAAIGVRDSMGLMNREVMLGVATGHVLTSYLDSEARCEFVTCGGIVDVAAQLVSAAVTLNHDGSKKSPGGAVVCDVATRDGVVASSAVQRHLLPEACLRGWQLDLKFEASALQLSGPEGQRRDDDATLRIFRPRKVPEATAGMLLREGNPFFMVTREEMVGRTEEVAQIVQC